MSRDRRGDPGDPGDEALALAFELADLADAITMARFGALDLAVTTKPDLTPVSEADHAAEAAIRDRLAREPGDHKVLGEEYGDDGEAEWRWIVDPIDGTKGYVRGLPVWATVVGLERAGELVLGMVSAPALHHRWWGRKGEGAFRDGAPIRVSRISALDDAQLSFAWDRADRFDADGFGQRALALSRRCWRTRAFGDFWQHVLVAEGSVDIALEPTVAIWDVAGVQVVVEAAGGRFTNLQGEARADGGSAVSTNGILHDEVLAHFASP
jgi:histidinol-phosphatase